MVERSFFQSTRVRRHSNIKVIYNTSIDDKELVELKYLILALKKYSVFLSVKKQNLPCNKNRFLSSSAMPRVGLLFNYIKRYITQIKCYFDYFIERKYKCRIFVT